MPKTEALELLCRNAAEVISKEEMASRLAAGRPLRVKAGFDPSAPDIHLGHTVLLRKLREFQDQGHKVVFIIGDYTAMIGDPTGQTKTRPALSAVEVKKNAATYQKQAFKILDKDPKKIEIVKNSEWFSKMPLDEFLGNLLTRFTVARILERDDFQKRLKEGQPVSMREQVYPILQAYDSVMVKADMELGGTDQKFNLLAGRNLQRDFGQVPQVVMTLPLLVGLDGQQKMSKSLGNHIGVTDNSRDMFGKLMSVPDALMESYYGLLTGDTLDKGAHPRQAKARLARLVTASFYDEKTAAAEAAEFDRVFSKKEEPADPTLCALATFDIDSANLLKQVKAADSTSQAYRLIRQGAVTLDGQRLTDPKTRPPLRDGSLLKVGKKSFFRIALK